MCGITGIASFDDKKVDAGTLCRMTSILKHRGPDEDGIYLSLSQNPTTKLKVGLGHRRLKIIDLETGHQPISNEDKTIWIVYNGETYNFRELKELLIAKGHQFTTKTDTEVIVHLYEEWGTDCVKHLRGMFAFCIWDSRYERLFLARDRIGQKPLYYYHKDGVFLFGSEIKAILEHDIVKRELDLESLDTYLTYGYVPSPYTIYKGIEKLPPAHFLIVGNDHLKTERYWELSYADRDYSSQDECEYTFYDILTEATKIRLISDVPLGAFLSGGVDSSCVVALMSRLVSGKVRTFSIGFDDKDFNELKYARYIAKRFGTEHKELIVRPNALEVLPKLAWHYDQPFGDSSCIPSYYVSKMTKEFVTVALNGDGGDESFAGYERYKGVKAAEFIKRFPAGVMKLPRSATRFLDEAFNKDKRRASLRYARLFCDAMVRYPDTKDAYVSWVNYFTDDQKSKLLSENVKSSLKGAKARFSLKKIIESSDAPTMVEKIMNADVKSYLPEDLLVKIDIATMANSVEGRSPFLDHRLMEFAASLPLKYKLRVLDSKYILKTAFKDVIPLSFLNRKKKGFGVPVGRWFSNELRDFVKEMLLGKKAAKRDIFSREYIEQLLDEHQKKRANHTHRIWALLSFEMWHRIFIDRETI